MHQVKLLVHIDVTIQEWFLRFTFLSNISQSFELVLSISFLLLEVDGFLERPEKLFL